MLLESLTKTETVNLAGPGVKKTNNWQLRCAKQTLGVYVRLTSTWLVQTS